MNNELTTEEAKKQLFKWFGEGNFWRTDYEKNCKPINNGFQLKIYTKNNCYSIVFWQKENKTYFGCVAGDRKTHAGNDLADGDFSKETFHRMLCDIISYELDEKA